MSSEDKKVNLEGFYGTKWFAALPFVFFIVSCILLSFKDLLDIPLWSVLNVSFWLVVSLLAKNKPEYWNAVTKGMSDPSNAMVIGIYLLAGLYGSIMVAGRVAEGLIWVGSRLNLGGGAACMFTYLASAAFGVATGTSFGTVVTMTPVLYPAAICLGANPIFAAGAVLSGAVTGDHFAPVSDTTIIAASTQLYRRKEGSAEIGEVVKERVRHVAPIALMTCALYFILGSGTVLDAKMSAEVLEAFSHQPGLFMLVPLFG